LGLLSASKAACSNLLRCSFSWSASWEQTNYKFRFKEYIKITKTITYVEEFYLLKCNAMQPTESQLMFQRNMSPPSSGLKNMLSKKLAWNRQQSHSFGCCLLHAGFLLSLLFNPEDRSNMLPWNISWPSMGYTPLYPRSIFLFELIQHM
jgi:hypothetical protein